MKLQWSSIVHFGFPGKSEDYYCLVKNFEYYFSIFEKVIDRQSQLIIDEKERNILEDFRGNKHGKSFAGLKEDEEIIKERIGNEVLKLLGLPPKKTKKRNTNEPKTNTKRPKTNTNEPKTNKRKRGGSTKTKKRKRGGSTKTKKRKIKAKNKIK